MMSLFDEEEVLKSYIRCERQEATQKATKENAVRLLKLGKIKISDLSICFPELIDEDIKELESEVMQLS